MRSRANPGRISTALVLSYAFDWLILICAAGIGAALSIITPNKRPFSLSNPEISYPFVHKEKVPMVLAGIVCFAVPAVIIFLVALILVPGPAVPKGTPKNLIWKRKLWEWHMGWLGLALSLASAFLITNGMKNLFGKPRPDLISRCRPDLANIALYATGGVNSTHAGFNLVTAAICTNPDKAELDDGFRSYPSGHSSFAAAGLIYLSLFLASKLAITIPFLSPRAYSDDRSYLSPFPSHAQRIAAGSSGIIRPVEKRTLSSSSDQAEHPSGHNAAFIAARNEAAAPPVYLLAVAIIPWFASIYISSTRYSDFRHHGFDILFGYFIGLVCAIFAFRYYHLPIGQGAGWAWGPRSRDRSFWAGIGVGSYAGTNRRSGGVLDPEVDLESGPERRATNDVGEAGENGNAV
ncbi:uncharacterized protein BP5553_01945 [Venustampulla echinocandica]|uniref:Phosphatidic acid phosphatase type 2/haloperoxidase domain-containing protein n=1 Tax=Venustampulla echinocandica TaxID=2656787 RepID=A0A370U2F9_9HELO|nr:uncharacterized protein BP5553_01945 [Venustampulla echinocandica]RDL41966.1 hypothetical protein BP5553_01945 [Venustampulla echinocandica]